MKVAYFSEHTNNGLNMGIFDFGSAACTITSSSSKLVVERLVSECKRAFILSEWLCIAGEYDEILARCREDD
jgi:hypothetical protein